MAIRNLRYEGDDILNKKSREIETIDEKLQTLIDDMIDTMHKYNGVGLAAVQVGILKRVFVVDLYDDKGPIVFINPVILKTKGEREVEEGCLSFPNQFAKVIRPEEVTAEYTDRNGKRVKVKAKEGETVVTSQTLKDFINANTVPNDELQDKTEEETKKTTDKTTTKKTTTKTTTKKTS